jgi:hypothetical protein
MSYHPLTAEQMALVLPELRNNFDVVRFVEGQETLDPEFEKILHDNLWELYEKEGEQK